jgi:hypothetical protein
MEKSREFDYDRFIQYLGSIHNKMPPFGKPRAFIDNFKPRNPLPAKTTRNKSSIFPEIRKSKNSTYDQNWRMNSKPTDESVDGYDSVDDLDGHTT